MDSRASERKLTFADNNNAPLSHDLPEMEALPPEFKNFPPDFNRMESFSYLSPWNWQRIFFRALMTGSVALSPLFSYFLYQSIIKVRDLVLKEFEAEDVGWASAIFTILAIYFTAANFIGSPPSLNPIEDSEDLLRGKPFEEEEINSYSRGLANFNKGLALPSFAHFAADNAIAIAGLTSNNRYYYLGLGIPFTIFSVIHQHIMTRNDIEAHCHRFINAVRTLHTAESSLIKIFQSPLKSLEVTILCSSKIAYQAIAAGYIADQLAKVFNLGETDSPVMPWILSATFLTAYITAFSKVLSIYDDYFNPAFESLTAHELSQIKLSVADHLLNGGIALTRTGALGWLTCRFGPQATLPKALLATGVCLSVFIHPFYVLYQNQKHEAALKERQKRVRFRETVENDDSVDVAISIPPVKLFNRIAKHYETPGLRRGATVLNVSARAGQLLSFIGFVADVLETADANGYPFPFNFKDTLALGILWGTPIVIIEGKADQEPLIQAATYHRAKFQIGAPTEALAKKNIVTRVVAGFFYSKEQYSKTRLREVVKKLEGGEEFEMFPLVPGRRMP